ESTKFLSDPQIKAATASSSFSMEKIRDVYMTVFIVIPHDRIQTHATWLRLVIASAMQAIKNRSRIRTPAHHRCMFLIDEFGSIGHINDVPRDIAIMAGFGLDLTLIVQGLDQLKHHYGEAKNTILSNCGYKWFCYVGDLDTAKYLSETLGKKTVRTVSTSTSQSMTGRDRQTEGESTTHGETGRDLLTPDEILNLGKDVAILLNPVTNAGYLRPVDYWRLMEEFPDSYPSSLTYDDNPYRRPTRSTKPAG
ncbi:MAG: type IV secretory system conjugative DNA transfer family protein, partial [Nitrospirales bacterium]